VEGKNMAKGTVKWFNKNKGFGFIEQEDGGEDVFIHINDVERAGLDTLLEGQKVQFELKPGQKGKTQATSLSKV
jgi:CspA family cold shock protein